MKKRATFIVSSALAIGAAACTNQAIPTLQQDAGLTTQSAIETPSFRNGASLSIATPAPQAPNTNIYRRADVSTVSIVRSDRSRAEEITQAEIEAMVREAVQRAGGMASVVKNGDVVVLKPNLVQMRVDSTQRLIEDQLNGVTTDWRVTAAVAKLVREANPDGTILVMEASATGSTHEVMAYYHYTKESMPEVDAFVSLNEDNGKWQAFDAEEIVCVPLEDGLLHKEYYLNRQFYEADVLISIPCLKTTNNLGVTAAIKNVCIGAPPGNIYGKSETEPSKIAMVSHDIRNGEIFKWLVDFYRCKPIDFVVIDGLQGFQRGPTPSTQERTQTDKMNMRMILAGQDAVATDTVCALIMGWDPQTVGYLPLFQQAGIGHADPAHLLIEGATIDEVRENFLIRKVGILAKEIPDSEEPQIRVIESSRAGDKLSLKLAPGEEIVKIEIYVDGALRLLKTADEDLQEAACTLPQDGETHAVELVAYDRFLHETRIDLDINP